MTGALSGLRVVDLANLFAVPLVSAHLADLGADVVKVEPPTGDPLEQLGAGRGGRSFPYVLANRGKRRVTIDPATPEGLEQLHALVDRADVVVSNQPTKLLERWGCAPAQLAQRNPRVVLATVSCYGTTGPLGDQPGNGSLAEAFGGLTGLTGEADGPPLLPSVALGDVLSSLAGAFGIVAACWHRDAGGGAGQHVDVSMYEPIIALLGPAAAAWSPGEAPPARTGSRVPGGVPRNVYRAGDGRYLVLSGTTDAQVARVLTTIGRDGPGDQARYARSADRLQRADELDALVAGWIAQHPRDEVLAAFQAVRVPVAPVHDLAELAEHPQVVARGSLRSVTDPQAGEVTVPGPPAHLTSTPAAPGPPPGDPIPFEEVLAAWPSR